MAKRVAHPEVARLARQLGVRARADPAEGLRRYALQQVGEMVAQCPVTSLPELLRLVALYLSVKLEYVREPEDIARFARQYRRLSGTLRQQLEAEFLRGDTLGYLLAHSTPGLGELRYVAFIDARGDRAFRSYFTAWHELTHRILTPPQLAFAGFRRVTATAIEKDPIESLVDRLAGELAFYAPLFTPALSDELSAQRHLSLAGIERVRAGAAPEASFYATALACVRLAGLPVCFLFVSRALKRGEQRRLRSPQLLFPGLPPEAASGEVRAVTVAAHASARARGLRIFGNMRVPAASVIHQAFDSGGDCLLSAQEDQASWETSSGRLPRLPLAVEAMRRGAFVYALMTVPSTETLRTPELPKAQTPRPGS